MNRFALRRSGALVVCALGAGIAHSGNVVMDSEQRAAAGVLTYLQLGGQVPSHLAVLTYSAKDFTERTLRLLEAVHTPASLRRATRGVVVPCPVSGSFSAKLSRSSQQLDIVWSACTLEIYGARHILTGPAQVTLCDDDFTPATVSELRVGSATQNLVERFVIDGVPSGAENQIVRNIRLAGLIPFGRPTTDDNFEGRFSYSLDGTYQSTNTIQVAAPGNVFERSEYRLEAQHAWVSGVLDYDDLGTAEDVRFNSGRFTQSTYRSAVGDSPEERSASALDVWGLRVRDAVDYQLDSQTLLVEGWAQYLWPAASGYACSSGGYTFDTREPLRRHPGAAAYSAGRALINGTAGLRLSANADPAESGEMHVDLNVAGVGRFEYDGNSFAESRLPVVARCVRR